MEGDAVLTRPAHRRLRMAEANGELFPCFVEFAGADARFSRGVPCVCSRRPSPGQSAASRRSATRSPVAR